jgi:Integrase core domain
LAGHDEMARDRPWDAAVRRSHAPRVGAGEPGASAATRRVEGAPAASAAERHEPAERVIGSIRRECLDHVAVMGERHLREILSQYVDYYNRTRTHLSLAKDAPEPRSVQPASQGRVVGATHRWAPSRIPAASGVTSIGRVSGGHSYLVVKSPRPRPIRGLPALREIYEVDSTAVDSGGLCGKTVSKFVRFRSQRSLTCTRRRKGLDKN